MNAVGPTVANARSDDKYPLADTCLKLPSCVTIESEDSSSVLLVHTENYSRLRVSRKLYDLIRVFVTPQPCHRVISEPLLKSLHTNIEKLIAAGFLVDTSGQRQPSRIEEKLLASVSPTLFRAPYRHPGAPQTDVAIVGVPYDGGSFVLRPGSRNGPKDIRARSCEQEYRVDLSTGTPLGWIEVDSGERLLEGVTITDWGNVRFTHGEGTEAILARVASVCSEIENAGSFPVFIGGDHSISLPIVDVLQRHQKLHVVWLDAHADYGRLSPPVCNHQNVVTWIRALPKVEQVIVAGNRGYTYSHIDRPPAKVSIVSASQLQQFGAEPILSLIPDGAYCYISIDIDVLDPAYAPGTSTPVPGGLTPDSLKQILRRIAQRHDIVGFDLVEVNASCDPGPVTAILAGHILTVCLAAVMNRRRSHRWKAHATVNAAEVTQ